MDKPNLSKYSLKQLDSAFACLPDDNPWKDIFAQEIEKRVDRIMADRESANVSNVEKGKAVPIGTISTHGGKRVRKTAQGWVPVKTGQSSKKDKAPAQPKAKDHHEQGQNLANQHGVTVHAVSVPHGKDGKKTGKTQIHFITDDDMKKMTGGKEAKIVPHPEGGHRISGSTMKHHGTYHPKAEKKDKGQGQPQLAVQKDGLSKPQHSKAIQSAAKKHGVNPNDINEAIAVIFKHEGDSTKVSQDEAKNHTKLVNYVAKQIKADLQNQDSEEDFDGLSGDPQELYSADGFADAMDILNGTKGKKENTQQDDNAAQRRKLYYEIQGNMDKAIEQAKEEYRKNNPGSNPGFLDVSKQAQAIFEKTHGKRHDEMMAELYKKYPV